MCFVQGEQGGLQPSFPPKQSFHVLIVEFLGLAHVLWASSRDEKDVLLIPYQGFGRNFRKDSCGREIC